MESRYMSRWYNFIGINCLILVLIFFGTSAYFYEDSIYIHYTTSILKDFDFNIINQVSPDFTQVITEKYSYPSHHSVFQIPFILLSYIYESLLRIFPAFTVETFRLTGILMSFISLLMGFVFTREAAAELQVEMKFSHFFVFFFSSALFYFSFFTLTVIEIFLFPLCALALILILRTLRRETGKLDSFILGILAAILTSAKIFYLPFTFIGFLSIILRKISKDKWLLINFFGGTVSIVTIVVLKDIASFGEVISISKSLAVLNKFSWLDLYYTFKDGIFGVGGIFHTNPVYLIATIGLILLGHASRSKVKSLLLILSMLAVMAISFFHAIMVIGPVLEDHYVGRMGLAGLPFMLIGFSYLINRLKNIVGKYLLAGLLIGFQIYNLANYLTISSQGHYAYAMRKTAENFREVTHYLSTSLAYTAGLFVENIVPIIMLHLLILLITWLIISKTERAIKTTKFYLLGSTLFLIIASLSNLALSQKNGEAFYVSEGLENKVTISNHGLVYSFIYITDGFRTQYYNTSDPELKKQILEKHSEYLKSLRPHLLKASPEFLKAVETQDVEFGFFK